MNLVEFASCGFAIPRPLVGQIVRLSVRKTAHDGQHSTYRFDWLAWPGLALVALALFVLLLRVYQQILGIRHSV